MEQIRMKLTSEKTHQNVKLFLLRLILNCSEMFRPFAKHFGKEILDLVTSSTTWPGNVTVNYFSLDLIVMLLSWYIQYLKTIMNLLYPTSHHKLVQTRLNNFLNVTHLKYYTLGSRYRHFGLITRPHWTCLRHNIKKSPILTTFLGLTSLKDVLI